MQFEDLKAFVSVARLGSFTRTALQLRVAQSALSKRVKRLEARLGTPLLVRHGRGIELTAAGETLLSRSTHLIEELGAIERDISTLNAQPGGEVRIALPPFTSTLVSPGLARQCEDLFPGIRLRILEGTSANSHAMLAAGEIDLALTYNAEAGADTEVRPVFAEPLFLLCRPVAPGEQPLPARLRIRDLAHLPLLLPARPHSIRVLVERLCAGHGVHPRIKAEVDGVSTLLAMAEEGFGVTIFSLPAAQSMLAAGRLSAVPFAAALMNWKLCIAWRRGSQRYAAMHAVKDLAGKELKRLLAQGRWPGAREL